MTKDDGSLTLRGEVTPLMKLFLQRRSARKYARGAASGHQVATIIDCVERFIARAALPAPRVAIVGGAECEAVVKGATAGLIGKTNPWLPFSESRHMILCGAVYGDPDDTSAVELAIKQAAMAMHVAVLAATELGLATCWMTGINHQRVELAHPLADGARLVALSPLGLTRKRRALSWDSIAFHTVSKRRKPLEDLWMEDRWRVAR